MIKSKEKLNKYKMKLKEKLNKKIMKIIINEKLKISFKKYD